jgi:predicted RNA methylase
VTALEADPERAARLAGLPNVEVLTETLEEFVDRDGVPAFDAVVMNVPFLSAARKRWGDEIFQGWSLVAPRGRLMVVGPADFAVSRDFRDREVRALVAKHGGRVDDLVELFDVEVPSVVVTLDRAEARGRTAGRSPAGRGQRPSARSSAPTAPARRSPARSAARTPRPSQLDLFAPPGGGGQELGAPADARTRHEVSDEELRAVLREATLDGCQLKLAPRRLARPVFEALHELLRLLGGRWVSAARVHRFEEDPGAALAAFEAGGPRPLAARAGEGFVPTPRWLADELVTRDARLHEGTGPLVVLDPSMGAGALVEAVLRCRPEASVTGVEPNAARAARFGADPRVRVVVSTFEAFAQQVGDMRFGAVVMNPPFAVPGDRALWISHVLTAWELLAPGGWLACIAPRQFEGGAGRRHDEVRRLVERFGSWRRLPEDAFASSGADVLTGVLTLRKPLG